MNPNNMNVNQTGQSVNNNPVPAGNMNFVMGGTPENTMSQAAPVQPAVTESSTPTSASQPVMPTSTGESLVQPTVNVVNEQPVIQPVNPVPGQSDVLSNQAQPTLNQGVESVQPVQSVNGLNTIAPAPFTNETVNTEVNVPSALEEPEEKKKINPIIIVLVILLLTGIGVALGFMAFKMFGNKGDSEEEPVEIVEENTKLSNNTINNDGVDTEKLNGVLGMLGIAPTADVANNDSLNYYISNNNYAEKANDIIVFSTVDASGNTTSNIDYPQEYDKMSDVGACSEAVSCALISKTDAESVLKKYNLGTDLTKYFYKSSEIDDVYGIHYGGTLVLDAFNNEAAGITHNVTASIVNEADISINDTQTLAMVGESGSVETSNKTVIYTFKQNEDGSYTLESVSVSE